MAPFTGRVTVTVHLKNSLLTLRRKPRQQEVQVQVEVSDDNVVVTADETRTTYTLMRRVDLFPIAEEAAAAKAESLRLTPAVIDHMQFLHQSGFRVSVATAKIVMTDPKCAALFCSSELKEAAVDQQITSDSQDGFFDLRENFGVRNILLMGNVFLAYEDVAPEQFPSAGF
ncbi:hypothetical protein ACFL31_05255 [Candidatus Margulisiibacteriota bacterium]